jgi:hypothetical protein
MHNFKTWQLGLAAALAGSLLMGCASPRPALAPATAPTIQNRVTTVFPNVSLGKPKTSGLDQPLAVQLAPLLIWETGSALPAPTRTVTVQSGITLLNNQWHRQFTYRWNEQGVRITLNSADQPVLWEIQRDSSGATVLYAAQSLEHAARAEFGPALPTRKFSLERSSAEAPEVVVANVIEDGPLAMGPILYLRGQPTDVIALICRCMPSQFQTVLETTEYELQPYRQPQVPAADFSTNSLEQRLRLPRQF